MDSRGQEAKEERAGGRRLCASCLRQRRAASCCSASPGSPRFAWFLLVFSLKLFLCFLILILHEQWDSCCLELVPGTQELPPLCLPRGKAQTPSCLCLLSGVSSGVRVLPAEEGSNHLILLAEGPFIVRLTAQCPREQAEHGAFVLCVPRNLLAALALLLLGSGCAHPGREGSLAVKGQGWRPNRRCSPVQLHLLSCN